MNIFIPGMNLEIHHKDKNSIASELNESWMIF